MQGRKPSSSFKIKGSDVFIDVSSTSTIVNVLHPTLQA